VRQLAQRSGEAAREIKALIGANVERVEAGASLVDQAGDRMRSIVESIQQVNQIVAHISEASREQRSGIEQVGSSVQQMDKAVQQNAALVEQSAAAAESLREQAREMARAVAFFDVA
jgi:methyl-accepting chemotaxis protein